MTKTKIYVYEKYIKVIWNDFYLIEDVSDIDEIIDAIKGETRYNKNNNFA